MVEAVLIVGRRLRIICGVSGDRHAAAAVGGAGGTSIGGGRGTGAGIVDGGGSAGRATGAEALPFLPPEVWFLVMYFFQRRDWLRHVGGLERKEVEEEEEEEEEEDITVEERRGSTRST